MMNTTDDGISQETDMINQLWANNTNNFVPVGSGLEWDWMRISKVIFFTPIVFFAIFGNFLALFAFITRYSQMKSPTHFFIANLALADFAVGILCLPFLAVTSITDKWYFGQQFCFAYIIMHLWFCSCSIYSTCAICVERYVGVRYPLNHKRIMSTFRVVCIIIFIWIYGGIVTSIAVFAWADDDDQAASSLTIPTTYECTSPTSSPLETYECKSNKQLGHVVFSTVFILYIPVVIMVIFYTRIYMIATQHLKVLRNTGSNRMLRRGGNSSRKSLGLQQDADSGVSTTTVVTIDSVSLDLDVDEQRKAARGNGGLGDENRNNQWFPSMRRLQLPLTLHEPSSHDSTERLVKATSSKKHIYLAKKLVILVGILLISYVPYYTVFLIRAVKPELASLQLFNILKWVRYGNSAINPFIYAYSVPAYRKAFVNIVVRRKLFN